MSSISLQSKSLSLSQISIQSIQISPKTRSMETPSSTRRITRSQIKTSMNNIPMSKKIEEPEIVVSRKRNGKLDRSALIDVTNDSPIVGLATGNLGTPSSLVKKRDQPKQTPGSGEALLRGQVKTLLQKVEEEADLSKVLIDSLPSLLQLQGGLVNSPSGLLAPTPANTPQVPNLSNNGDLIVDSSEGLSGLNQESGVHQDEMMVDEAKRQVLETEKSLNRSLLFDFFEKSEISDSSSRSSVLTCVDKSNEEDDSSIWSIQVNASTHDDEEEEEVDKEAYDEEEEEEEVEEDYEENGETGGGLLDELCAGLSKITVEENKLPEFEGKHVRFVYNSDDEIEGEEEVVTDPSAVSPSALKLKGLPVPEGKHLRFPEDEE